MGANDDLLDLGAGVRYALASSRGRVQRIWIGVDANTGNVILRAGKAESAAFSFTPGNMGTAIAAALDDLLSKGRDV